MGANSVSGAPFSVLLLSVLLQACYLDQITGISAAILEHKASLRLQAMYWDAVKTRSLGPDDTVVVLTLQTSFQTQMHVYLVLATAILVFR